MKMAAVWVLSFVTLYANFIITVYAQTETILTTQPQAVTQPPENEEDPSITPLPDNTGE